MRSPELLVPAGEKDSFVAAVQNGADAVYLGLESFNARRGAVNFSEADLAWAADYAHLRGVRVYLTANVLVLPDEMPSALELVDRAWLLGVDAVIVQDLGLLSVVHDRLPDVRLHASTQVGAHNTPTIEVLADAGASRVTLARETSLDEIEALCGSTSVEIESFVHGSLCVCYSGQCLMSSLIGGRSANRGTCAQPCRMPYRLLDEQGDTIETPGRYLLSPKDLAGVELLPELVRTGVAALKIEGRMKAPEYVALVTGVYRRALDRAVADPEAFQVTETERDTLEEAFSRGFTQGYLAGVDDERLMSLSRPNNRGVPVGRVTAAGAREAEVSLDRALDADDRIEFWTSAGRFSQTAAGLSVAGRKVHSAPVGETVRVETERAVRSGDRVFRVANARLLEAARRTFAGRHDSRRMPTDVKVVVRRGAPLLIEMEAGGRRSDARGADIEDARTRAVTADEIVEHVGRMGGSAYEPVAWDIELDSGVGVRFSELHDTRRRALEALDAVRLEAYRERSPRGPELRAPSGGPASRGGVELVVSVPDEDSAAACLAAGADRVLVACDEGLLSGSAGGVVPLLPRVVHDAELSGVLECAGDTAAVSGNLGVTRVLARDGCAFEADWPLGITNPWTAIRFAREGAGFIWASPELNAGQLSALAKGSPIPVGTVVFGRQELMVTEHCMLQSAGPCDRSCASCARRERRWFLEDEKGYRFPVVSDARGRSHILNSRTLDLSAALGEVLATGVAAIRVDVRLAEHDPAKVTAHFRSLLNAALEGVAGAAARGTPSDAGGLRIATDPTGGHFFRGVR